MASRIARRLSIRRPETVSSALSVTFTPDPDETVGRPSSRPPVQSRPTGKGCVVAARTLRKASGCGRLPSGPAPPRLCRPAGDAGSARRRSRRPPAPLRGQGRRQEGGPHQPGVHRRCTRTSLGDGPHDEALAPAHVAADEDPVDVGLPVGVPADSPRGVSDTPSCSNSGEGEARRSRGPAGPGRHGSSKSVPRSSRSSAGRRRTASPPRAGGGRRHGRCRRRRNTRC